MKKHKLKKSLPFIGAATIVLMGGVYTMVNKEPRIFDDISTSTQTFEEQIDKTEIIVTEEEDLIPTVAPREDNLDEYLASLDVTFQEYKQLRNKNLQEIVAEFPFFYGYDGGDVHAACSYQAVKKLELTNDEVSKLIDLAIVIETYNLDIDMDIEFLFKPIAETLNLPTREAISYIQAFAKEYHFRTCDDIHYKYSDYDINPNGKCLCENLYDVANNFNDYLNDLKRSQIKR